jgi:hypothetical protein
MTERVKCFLSIAVSAFILTSCTYVEQLQTSDSFDPNEIPRLEKKGDVTQLIVDGEPFLILGGELHNSSSSSLEYTKPIWPKLKQMNLNTVLAAVSWDMIEPQEGQFDFTIVDGMIKESRRHDLRLIILWFGSWKNGISHYVPSWVKNNVDRFPRVRIASGKNIEVLSTLSYENRRSDALAFTELMRHIRLVDSRKHTVIMVQVQNEVGVLGDSRDRCPLAGDAFAKPVPAELMQYLIEHKENLLPGLKNLWSTTGFKESGTWTEVFGDGFGADEIFMAWNYARYVDQIAEAGKAEYPLPMFVNAWIVQPEDKKPGDYPSGGPQAEVHDIWRAGALNIDLLAPDIYLPNFAEVCTSYSRGGNPLFIPESFAGERGAANAFYALGQQNAMGYSPFGIDSRVTDDVNDPFSKAYDVLSQLAPQILEAQAKGKIVGVMLSKEKPGEKFELGDYTLAVELRQQRGRTIVPDLAYGLIISTGPDEYIVAGNDIQITFFPNTPGPQMAGLASVYEGEYIKGKWVTGRKLNGDAIMLNYHLGQMAEENRTGSVLRIQDGPAIRHVELYRF